MTTAAELNFHVLLGSTPALGRKPHHMSWKAEVTTAVTNDDWAGNAMRFATREEAMHYAADLAYRWTAVRNTRVVESTDPVNYSFIGGVSKYLDPV